MRFRTANSGAGAIELARARRPEVVLMDIGMPGMDGYEVARRLRQQPGLGEILIAAVSGFGVQEARRRSKEAGFDRHLLKPVGRPMLEELLGGVTVQR